MQVGEYSFAALRKSESYAICKHTREFYKTTLREIAIDWQFQFRIMNYSYEDLANWREFSVC